MISGSKGESKLASPARKSGRRDFRAEIAHVKCWDRKTTEIFERTGYPREDCVLQNREELIGFCEWIEANEIRSFLEIGIWTGGLLTLLQDLFQFQLVAAADNLFAKSIGLDVHIPDGTLTFFGDSHSPAYSIWRETLGPIDLVLIDGDHSYEGVRQDFEVNRGYPHRFLAFHDIIGFHPMTEGVKRLWNELDGSKTEIIRPHYELGTDQPTMGIGIWSHP